MATTVERVVRRMPPGTILNGAKTHKAKYKMPNLGIPWPFEVIQLPNGFGVSCAEITPSLAELMLAVNWSKNRKQKPGRIKQYGSDMAGGRFPETHQGLAFNSEGELSDGQNRLQACKDSGAKFKTLVFFGIPEESITGVDIIKSRSVSDSANILGLGDVTPATVATVRSFLRGPDSEFPVLSNSFILAQIEKYEPMLVFVNRWPGGIYMGKAAVRGAIGRAVYTFEPEKVARFADILCDKTPARLVGDFSAVQLRISVNNQVRLKAGSGNREATHMLYCRAQRAIVNFMAGERTERLFPAYDDLMPLPTDEQIKKTHAAIANYFKVTAND